MVKRSDAPWYELHLIKIFSGVFTDLHSVLSEVTSEEDRVMAVAKASLKYRSYIREIQTLLEKAAIESPSLEEECGRAKGVCDVIHALLHIAEVSFYEAAEIIQSGISQSIIDMKSRPIVLPLLRFLRDNFVQVVDEMLLLQVLNRCSSPTLMSTDVINDIWDVVAKLVIEGQPNNAGRLLQRLAEQTPNENISIFANLLVSYPVIGGNDTSMSNIHDSEWFKWHDEARSVQELLEGRVDPNSSHANSVLLSLCEIVSGTAWGSSGNPRGLQTLRVRPDGVISRFLGTSEECPHQSWFNLCICHLIFCEPPSVLGRRDVSRILRQSLVSAGERLIDSPTLDENSSEADQVPILLTVFVRTLEGDAPTILTVLPMVGPLGLLAAAVTADLLYFSNQLSAPVLVGSRMAPLRAHFLLRFAELLPPSQFRVAATFIDAARPQVLMACLLPAPAAIALINKYIPSTHSTRTLPFNGKKASDGLLGILAPSTPPTESSLLVSSKEEADDEATRLLQLPINSDSFSSLPLVLRNLRIMLAAGSLPDASQLLFSLFSELSITNEKEFFEVGMLCRLHSSPAALRAITARFVAHLLREQREGTALFLAADAIDVEHYYLPASAGFNFLRDAQKSIDLSTELVAAVSERLLQSLRDSILGICANSGLIAASNSPNSQSNHTSTMSTNNKNKVLTSTVNWPLPAEEAVSRLRIAAEQLTSVDAALVAAGHKCAPCLLALDAVDTASAKGIVSVNKDTLEVLSVLSDSQLLLPLLNGSYINNRKNNELNCEPIHFPKNANLRLLIIWKELIDACAAMAIASSPSSTTDNVLSVELARARIIFLLSLLTDRSLCSVGDFLLALSLCLCMGAVAIAELPVPLCFVESVSRNTEGSGSNLNCVAASALQAVMTHLRSVITLPGVAHRVEAKIFAPDRA